MDSKPMTIEQFITQGEQLLTSMLQAVCIYDDPPVAKVTGTSGPGQNQVTFNFALSPADTNALPSEVGIALTRITQRIGATHQDANSCTFNTSAVLPMPSCEPVQGMPPEDLEQ
jgi:hypothetical protein